MTTNQNRVQAGVPTGGQFAAGSKAEQAEQLGVPGDASAREALVREMQMAVREQALAEQLATAEMALRTARRAQAKAHLNIMAFRIREQYPTATEVVVSRANGFDLSSVRDANGTELAGYHDLVGSRANQVLSYDLGERDPYGEWRDVLVEDGSGAGVIRLSEVDEFRVQRGRVDGAGVRRADGESAQRDQAALDEIASYLAGTERWDSDAPEVIAEIVGRSGRPHPGGFADEDWRAAEADRIRAERDERDELDELIDSGAIGEDEYERRLDLLGEKDVAVEDDEAQMQRYLDELDEARQACP